MWRDTWTVYWKEWREFLNVNGKRGRFLPFFFLIIFGIVMPIQTGRLWLESPLSLGYFAWIPFIMGSSWAADSYAGERERHTLETLLASRLPDNAIFWGKFLTIVSYSWGMVMISYVLSAAAVNIATWDGSVGWYPPYVVSGGSAISLLISIMATAAGILISLRAKTVRQAQQKMSVAILAVTWGPILLIRLLPGTIKLNLTSGATDLAAAADLDRFVLPGIIGALVVVLAGASILTWAARKRFTRSQLIG